MAGRPEPDNRAAPAMIVGAAVTVLTIGAGIYYTGQGMVAIWVFAIPWAFVGLLLIVWGRQRLPSDGRRR